MRSVRRIAVLPPTLRPGGTAAEQIKEWAGAYPAQTKFKFSDSIWNSVDVRGALYAQHGRVCAYCGCELVRGNRGDVEHFRPKSNIHNDETHGGYWWLAYDYCNYLIACRTCNSTFKGNKFPLVAGAVRVRYEHRHQLAHEARLLLDPCVDELDNLLYVDLDNPLFPIKPKAGLKAAVVDRIEASLEFFGVNWQPELVKARRRLINKIAKAINAGQPQRVRQFAVRYRPNSLVARYILQQNAPAGLPTPAEETEWLMRDMLRTLSLILKIRLSQDNERLKADQDEILWSFAFLLADPPPGGSTADVADFLSKQKIETYVSKMHAKL